MPGTAVDAAIHVVLSGFRLEVQVHAAAGETVAVMGPSGAGKSTLLGALAGLVRLDEGRITVGERVLDSTTKPRARTAPMSRGVVLLGQEPRLFPHMTARENIGFGRRARGLARAAAATEADEWLWRVGLDGLGDRRPAELSGGQQQRVAIARALATAPAAVLLDEPLTALDPETADGIRAVLREQLSATRTTAFVTTHSAVDAVALAQKLIVLEEGRVTQEGSVRAVLAVPATRFVAAVAGVNRLAGHLDDGAFVCRGVGGRTIRIAVGSHPFARHSEGVQPGDAVAAVFRPSAVRVTRVDAPTWTAALRLPVRGTAGTPPDAIGSGRTSPAAHAVGPGGPSAAGPAPSRAALRARTASESAREPGGPSAGEWLARIARLEETPAGVRVRTEDPAVAIDLPADQAAELELQPGMPVWLRIAPEDVRLQA